jgi:hypothetical protein
MTQEAVLTLFVIDLDKHIGRRSQRVTVRTNATAVSGTPNS